MLQKSSPTTAHATLISPVVGSSDENAAMVSEDAALLSASSRTPPDRYLHVPQACSADKSSAQERDSADINCIPDTQISQPSNYVPGLLPATSSPDVEMIPDTPDSASTVGIRKTFQRSYLASASNLLVTCPQKKVSPPRRKTARENCRIRKSASLSVSTEETMDGGISLQSNFPCSTVQSNRTNTSTHVPYPPSDVLNKRCATDLHSLSKRCDNKVTPTKAVSSTNGDVIYGTVPNRLFQEALSREKRKQASMLVTNKTTSRPGTSNQDTCKLSDLNSDPSLLEVLSELKVDSRENGSVQNVVVPLSCHSVNSVASAVSSCHGETGGKTVETACGGEDDDLEDILGELRQQNGTHNSIPHGGLSDSGKNQVSVRLSDVKESPSSMSYTELLCSSAEKVTSERNIALLDRTGAMKFKHTHLKLEQQEAVENVTSVQIENMFLDAVDGKSGDVSLASVESSVDNKSELNREEFSSHCDDCTGYISYCFLGIIIFVFGETILSVW